MEEEVGGAEHGGERGQGVHRVLHGPLSEHVGVTLERHDVVGVCTGGGERGVAAAADDLVDAVEGEERGSLHHAAVRGGRSGPEGGRSVESCHVHSNDATPPDRPAQCGDPYSGCRENSTFGAAEARPSRPSRLRVG